MFFQKIFISTVVATLAIVLAARITSAAEKPKLLVTWSARTYTPADYAGKVLPSMGSEITVSFDLIQNGKLIDISSYPILWYLDNHFIQNNEGTHTITLTIPPGEERREMRIEVSDYPGGTLSYGFFIPVARPEAVIEWDSPSQESSRSLVELSARPYFFNTSGIGGLKYLWKVNGVAPKNADNPQVLYVHIPENTPNQTPLIVDLSIQNVANIFEFGSKSITINYAGAH
jgi:hypothetical protein